MKKKEIGKLEWELVRKLAIPFFILFAVCVVSTGMAAAAATPSVSIDPATTSVNQSESFTVNISINPEGIGVSGVDIKYLTFNPAIVQCDRSDIGDFLGASPVTVKNVIDNTEGTIWYAVASTTGEHKAKGTFATVTFTVKSDAPNGTYALDFTAVELGNASGPITPIQVNNGTFTVGTQPEPVKPTVSIEPASTSGLGPGDSFGVNVAIDPKGIGVSGVDIKYLTFNPAIVQCDRSDIGDFLGASPVIVKNIIDNTEGTIWYAVASTTGEHTSPGTFATVNFTVKSDAPDDTYALDFTTVELGNASGPITPIKVNNGTFTVGTEIDLIVESITPNCKHLFANESNDINATIKNVGTEDAGAFNVDFVVDEFTEKVSVSGLAAGASKELTVTDTTLRTAGESVTINVTIDLGGKSNETTVTVVNNGYKGKRYTGGEDITTVLYDALNGNVIYSIGDSYYLSSSTTPWSSYTANWTASDLPVSTGATVETARLYVYYTWDKVQGMPDNVSLTFNGNLKTRDAFYTDRKGYGSWDYPSGMLAYDVTGDFLKTGINVADLDNLNPVAGNPSIQGMLLTVIYADSSEPERTIWINEGCDILAAKDSYCVNSFEATAFALFTGPITGEVTSAKLITVAPQADEGDDKNRLYFNYGEWHGIWDGYAGSTQLGIAETDVKDYLSATDNFAMFQSHIPAGETKGDYMEASNAILVVTEEIKPVKYITVAPAEATLAVGGTQVFTATAYDQYGNTMAGVVITWASTNLTVGTVYPTTATTGPDGTATTTFYALAKGTTYVVASHGDVYGYATVIVEELSVKIYTDKTVYHQGDTQHLGLDVTNPGAARTVTLAIWLELPDKSIYVLMNTQVDLPANLDYQNPNFMDIPMRFIPDGKYTWNAALIDPVTGEFISYSTAEWRFSFMGTATGTATEDITTVLEQTKTSIDIDFEK